MATQFPDTSQFYSPRQETERSQGTSNANLQPVPNLESIGAPRTSLDTAHLPSEFPSNTSIGETLDTAGKGIANVIKVKDEVNKIQSSQETRETIDKIRDQFGVAEAIAQSQKEGGPLDPAGVTQEGVPLALNKLGTRLQNLNSAYQAGKLSDSYYGTQMEIAIRQVKDKYPGYTDHIDQVVHQELGILPANMVRKSVQSDLEKLNAKIQQQFDKKDTFILQHAAYWPPDYTDRQRGFDAQGKPVKDKPYTQTEVIAAIQTQLAKAQKNKDEKASLELLDEQGKRDTKRAEQHIARTAADLTFQFINTAAVKGLQSVIDEAKASGKQPDPQALAQFQGQFDLQMQQHRQRLFKMFTSLDPNDPGKRTLFELMGSDPNKLDQILNQSMYPLQGLQEAFKRNDPSLAGFYTNLAKYSTDKAYSELLQSDDRFARLSALHQTLGDNGFAAAQNNPAFNAQITGFWGSVSVLNALDGKGTGANAYNDAKQFGSTGDNNAKTHLGHQSSAVGILDNPGTAAVIPVENRLNTVKYWYNGDTTRYIGTTDGEGFAASERPTVWNRLFNDTRTKSITDLKNSGHPEAFNQYATAALDSFTRTYGPIIQSVQTGVEQRKFVNITYNAKTNQFDIEPTEAGIRAYAAYQKQNFRSLGTDTSEIAQTLALRKPVDEINKALATITPIMKERGIDKEQVLPTLLRGLGYDPSRLGSQYGDTWLDHVKIQDIKPNPNQSNPGAVQVEKGKKRTSDSGEFNTAENAVPEPFMNLMKTAEAPQGYNSFFGTNGVNNLTSLTLDQVRQLQKAHVAAGAESGAAGHFQLTGDTFDRIKDKLKLSGDTKFNEETQNKMGAALLDEAGYKEYKAGKLSKAEFAHNLSKTWAGLPTSSGKSYYQGVGSNKATVSLTDFNRAIDQL